MLISFHIMQKRKMKRPRIYMIIKIPFFHDVSK